MAIIAYWNKYLATILLVLGSLLVVAQPTDEEENPFKNVELSGNEKLQFNELFFQAEKQKNLGNLREAETLYKQLYDLDNENATVCFELAQIYLVTEKPEEAVAFAERAQKLDEENRWFSLLLAQVYRAVGENKKEVKVYKDLIALEPEEESHYFELSNAYLSQGEYKKAIEALDDAEALVGLDADITKQKKLIYLELGDFDGAVEELNKIIEAYPSNLDYLGTLAKMYQVNGYEEKALELYQKMLAIDPSDPRPNLDLAVYYRDKKDVKTSLRYLKKAMASRELDIDLKVPVLLSLFDAAARDSVMALQADSIFQLVLLASPKNPKAEAIYGDFLSKQNRGKEALEHYKKAIQLDEGSRFQIWEQVLLIQIQMQAYDSLIVYGPRAVELFPNQPLPYFFTGAAYNALEKPNQGLEYLEMGLAYTLGSAPLKEQFYLQFADAHHQLEQHTESDTYFDKALALNPNSANTLNNYAYYLSVREEKLDEALRMTVKSNNLSPNNATYLDTHAWVLYKQENYGEALTIMEKALALEKAPGAELLEHYGDILFKLNRKQDAKIQWQKALEKGGNTKELNKRLKKVS